jgi:hypothetical protein
VNKLAVAAFADTTERRAVFSHGGCSRPRLSRYIRSPARELWKLKVGNFGAAYSQIENGHLSQN